MTSTEWNAAIDAALAKVREQRAVFSSDAYATPQPIGGFMERFACNSIEVEIEALRKPDTPPTPAAEEREAVARALCIAGEEDDFNYKGYLELADAALSTLAQIRAAEILAAEANVTARIVAWLRSSAGPTVEADCYTVADMLERAALTANHSAPVVEE